MKYSQFNSIVNHNNQVFLYNSFENKFITLVPELKDLLVAANLEGIDNLYEIHPKFYDYLSEHKFLVDEDLDEVNQVKEISKKIDYNYNDFHLTINPTMNCNFKCWYCYETHIKSSKLENSVIDSINRFVTKTLANEKMQYLSVSFFGGEPLLYFDKNVVPIINHLVSENFIYKKQISTHFTTNGFLIDDKLISYFKNISQKPNFQITLDGNEEDHNKVRYVSKNRGSYREIVDNIKKLILNEFEVRLRINYTDLNAIESEKIFNDFRDIDKDILKNYLAVDYHRVWQNEKMDDTSDVIDKITDNLAVDNINVISLAPDNVINSCYADKLNSAVINYNGDLYKCTARDFTSTNSVGKISENGDLVWNEGYIEKRMNAKFNNKPCLSCRLLPICNGGCSQHAIEHIKGDDYCIYHFSDIEKDKAVKSKINEILATAS